MKRIKKINAKINDFRELTESERETKMDFKLVYEGNNGVDFISSFYYAPKNRKDLDLEQSILEIDLTELDVLKLIQKLKKHLKENKKNRLLNQTV